MDEQWGLLGFLLAVNPECLHVVAPLLLSETPVSAFCSYVTASYCADMMEENVVIYLSQGSAAGKMHPRLIALLCVSLRSFMLSLLELKEGFS